MLSSPAVRDFPKQKPFVDKDLLVATGAVRVYLEYLQVPSLSYRDLYVGSQAENCKSKLLGAGPYLNP